MCRMKWNTLRGVLTFTGTPWLCPPWPWIWHWATKWYPSSTECMCQIWEDSLKALQRYISRPWPLTVTFDHKTLIGLTSDFLTAFTVTLTSDHLSQISYFKSLSEQFCQIWKDSLKVSLRGIAFTRQTMCFVRPPWPWPTTSHRFILDSKWMFVGVL